MPVIRSRSAMIERSWARITSADRSLGPRDVAGRSASRTRSRRTASGIRSARSSRGRSRRRPRPGRGTARRTPPARGRRGRPRPRRAGRAPGCCAARGRAARRARRSCAPRRWRTRNGDEAHDRQALGGGVLELADEHVGGAGVVEQLERRRSTSPSSMPRAGPAQQHAILSEHQRRPARAAGAAERWARASPRPGRRHRRPGRRSSGAAPDRGRDERGDHDRLHGGLGDEEPAASRSSAVDMASATMSVSCQPPEPDDDHEQVGDEHPDRDAEGRPRPRGAAAGRTTCRGSPPPRSARRTGWGGPAGPRPGTTRRPAATAACPMCQALDAQPCEPGAHREPAAAARFPGGRLRHGVPWSTRLDAALPRAWLPVPVAYGEELGKSERRKGHRCSCRWTRPRRAS